MLLAAVAEQVAGSAQLEIGVELRDLQRAVASTVSDTRRGPFLTKSLKHARHVCQA